jgi:hypothetical protein
MLNSRELNDLMNLNILIKDVSHPPIFWGPFLYLYTLDIPLISSYFSIFFVI